MSSQAVVRTAIHERRVLRLSYGSQIGFRRVEPHALGVGRDGQALLRAYQIGGPSARGGIPDWRLFRLDRIRNIHMLDQQFAGVRPGYRRGDSAMVRVLAQL